MLFALGGRGGGGNVGKNPEFLCICCPWVWQQLLPKHFQFSIASTLFTFYLWFPGANLLQRRFLKGSLERKEAIHLGRAYRRCCFFKFMDLKACKSTCYCLHRVQILLGNFLQKLWKKTASERKPLRAVVTEVHSYLKRLLWYSGFSNTVGQYTDKVPVSIG